MGGIVAPLPMPMPMPGGMAQGARLGIGAAMAGGARQWRAMACGAAGGRGPQGGGGARRCMGVKGTIPCVALQIPMARGPLAVAIWRSFGGVAGWRSWRWAGVEAGRMRKFVLYARQVDIKSCWVQLW